MIPNRIRTQAKVRLQQFEATTLNTIRANAAGLRSQLVAKTREGDPAVNAIKDREVRDNIRSPYGNDVVKIEAFYSGCDDADVLAAIENAPRPFALVRPEVIAPATQDASRKPGPGAPAGGAEMVEGLVSSAFQQVGTHIQSL